MKMAILEKSLCSTCLYAGDCVFQHQDEIVECEEFQTSRIGAEEAAEIMDPLPFATLNGKAAMGICATCASVDDCRLSRGRRGVWECEEYR